MRRWLALVLLLGSASGAEAKPSGASRETPRRSLRSVFGVDAVRPLLRAEASETRRRAFERLGSLGTPRALELLARALDGDGAARDARERLAAVRALAPYAADPTAQDALIRALGGVEGHPDERALLVERTAALALAAAHEEGATLALARALRQPGRVSEHARLAFSVHRPKDLGPLLAASGAPSPALVRLLGELGDARGQKLVTALATRGDASLRAEAVASLFELAPAAGLALARTALATERDATVRLALVRVLLSGGDGTAARALGTLLAEPATRRRALELALELPRPELGPILAVTPEGDESERLLTALGQVGGAEALGRLERALAAPADASAALYALALSPDDDAGGVLERALERPALRRDAVRAATLRSAASGAAVAGLGAALEALAHGSAIDRAVAAWCRAVLEPEGAAGDLASGDPDVVRAVARAARSPLLALPAAERLAHETDPALRAALARALAVPEAADLVPSATLEELVATGGAATYVAALALAARDSEALRPRLRELLGNDDPLLRAHVALGLGASRDESALGLLADAYRAESDAAVRRAIVRAIAGRRGTERRPVLTVVAALEPDDQARALARRALGVTPTPAPLGHGTVWLEPPATPGDVAFVVLEGADGLALPFAADGDQRVTVAGLPDGAVAVSLAVATPGRARRPAPPPAGSKQ